MAVVKPCVPYCFFLLPLATAQLFLLLLFHTASSFGQVFAKVFLPVTYIWSYEMRTKNTVQKQTKDLKLQRICRSFKASWNHILLWFYCKQMTSETRSSRLNLLLITEGSVGGLTFPTTGRGTAFCFVGTTGWLSKTRGLIFLTILWSPKIMHLHKNTHRISTTMTNLLILFKKIITVYSENTYNYKYKVQSC